ncbi:hypothetical protein ACFO4E_24185 [Nocardiopsis mangrovi]|uniref:Colicin D immunity protein domain-containing protein n=1 Tax=Nocardiopsis mangrovi TaxID=1179818 RepID=A0ABV9E1H8_9ACTN
MSAAVREALVPFRVCISAFLGDRLKAAEFSAVFFDLARTSNTGLSRDAYMLVNEAMHVADSYTDKPHLLGGDLIDAPTMRERITDIDARLDDLVGPA